MLEEEIIQRSRRLQTERLRRVHHKLSQSRRRRVGTQYRRQTATTYRIPWTSVSPGDKVGSRVRLHM